METGIYTSLKNVFFFSYIKKQNISFIFLKSPFLIWEIDRCVSKAAAPGHPRGVTEAAAQCPEGERETKSSAETVHLVQLGESVAEQPGQEVGALWVRGT